MSHSLDSALIRYAKDGNVDKVRALLQRGADVNAKALDEDGHYWTALMWASDKGHLEVVCVLLNHAEVDVNIKGAYGLTALAHASRNGNSEVVRALLNHNGVEVNIENSIGWTALISASTGGHLEVVRALLNHNEVDVNIKDMFGNTALMHASFMGHLEVVSALLNQDGVDVNIVNTFGGTALIRASFEGHLEVVRALLNHEGVDVHFQGTDGETALEVARNLDNDDVARLLEEHMEQQRRREEQLEARAIETDPPSPNSPTQQGRKRARTQPSTSEPSEEDEQRGERRQQLLKRKPAESGDDAKIAQDRSQLLRVMNTSSADPVEVSLEYIEQCINKDHELGSGTFGDVFLAEDSRLKKKFAVKMIRTNTKCNEDDIKEMRRSFQRELSTLKRFRHPNIISLYGYSLTTNSSQQCLVYEYATNGSLAGFFTENGKRDQLSSNTRLSIMFELTRAVHFLHTGGCKVEGKGWKVFHRDIKSANICLADDFTPRLIDCGLAIFVQDDNSSVTPESFPSTLRDNTDRFVRGTPGYMCPEYIRKKFKGQPCPYIAAYDVYSIGVVLVEIILGRLNAAHLMRNDTRFLDVFEKYVQGERSHQRIADGWAKLMGDADATITWNPDSLEVVSKAAIQCMDPFPEARLSTKDLLDQLRDAINLNTNAGIQHPDAASAVDSGPNCLVCNNYRTDIKCSEGHVICSFCIVDKLAGDDIGCQLRCLIKECSSKLHDTDLYGRIPIETYNWYFKKSAERQI